MPDKHVATLNYLRSPYTAIRHCVSLLELSGLSYLLGVRTVVAYRKTAGHAVL
jgi:hypothetical protein